MPNERQVNQVQKAENKKKSTLDGVVLTPCGSHIAPVYKRVYDKELARNVVKKVDDTNLFEFIQASKSTTDLALLQKRFIELGEIPANDPTLQNNVDTAIMPSDIHSLYNMVNDVNGNYQRLPDEVQKAFGTPQDYLKAVLDGSAGSILAKAFAPQPQQKPAESTEVTQNE